MVRKKKQSSTGDQKAWLWDHTVVGILTNSDDRIPGILASFGLNVGSKRFGTPIEHAEDASEDEDINFVVLSSDVGVEKPDPKIFDAAEEVLKASLGRNDQNGGMIGSLPHNKAKHSLKEFELLHIGDNEQQDILGALNAGWNSILFDRKGRYSKEFSKGEAILSVDLRTSARRWTLVGRNVPVTQDLNALRYWKPSSV